MEQSNISRDHIAMEAMKVFLDKCGTPYHTLWDKVKKALGFGYSRNWDSNKQTPMFIAQYSYCIADAMIEEREKKRTSAE